MAYQIDRYNNTLLTIVEDGTIDSAATDIKFIGKNYAGYGEIQNENFLYLLENFAGANAPPRAISGQVWFDSANGKLKFYDGTIWRTVGGSEVQIEEPGGLVVGDFWWDSANDQLYVFNGTIFVLIGPQVAGTGTTQVISDIVNDDDNEEKPVIIGVIEDEQVFIVSPDEFLLNESVVLPGFSRIKQGLTLKDAFDENGDEVIPPLIPTGDTFRFWGTASNADKLNGFDYTDFVLRGSTNFDDTVTFPDAGIIVGDNLPFKLYIENVNDAVIENDGGNSTIIRFKANNSVGNSVSPIEITSAGLRPGADLIFNLGAPGSRFSTIYAQTLQGTATQANTLQVGTEYRSASLSASVNTIAARDASGNITANQFLGTATNASNLVVLGTPRAGNYNAVSNTVAVRDGAGDLTANIFRGTALEANTLLSGGSYRSASTAASNDTVAVRNGSGNLVANQFTGIATQAQLLQVNGGVNYRAASTNADNNTIAARTSSGNLRANLFEGTATSAQYADLAEKYTMDDSVVPGTAVMVSAGDKYEVEPATASNLCIGVVSTDPAYMMNSEADGKYVGLKGRLPVRVLGPVQKGQPVYAWKDGVCTTLTSNALVGVALETNLGEGEKLVECVLKV